MKCAATSGMDLHRSLPTFKASLGLRDSNSYCAQLARRKLYGNALKQFAQ
jgi:hypothetical protein